MKESISIVIFIDALGWEVLRNKKFLKDELPYRRKLRSVLGYSSACVPSILSGKFPKEHEHWSFYYHNKKSPFKWLKFFKFIPEFITKRSRVRNIISKLIKKVLGFTGYFQLYNVPFDRIGQLDYCEKKDLFSPGGLNKGDTIFDVMNQRSIPYHVSNWREGETTNLSRLENDLENKNQKFAFLYLADLDGLLHQVGKESPKVDEKLIWYEDKLKQTLTTARTYYKDVRVFICSDHGMATTYKDYNLMDRVEKLGFKQGQDYIACYDSTMARFWFKSQEAKESIEKLLLHIHDGRMLDKAELKKLGCDFEENKFGELIFLMNPGVIIVPSHMGKDTITGMHGYHPDHNDSDAVLLSNVEPETDPKGITDLFNLMTFELGINMGAK